MLETSFAGGHKYISTNFIWLLLVIVYDAPKEEAVHIIRTALEEAIQQGVSPFHHRYASISIDVNGFKYFLKFEKKWYVNCI